MNEKLEKEIEIQWELSNPIDEGMGVESAFIHIEAFDMIARHFYSLALEDVRKEVERRKEIDDIRYNNLHSPANPQDILAEQIGDIYAKLVSKRSFLSGEINGFERIINFIDNLTK